MLVSSKFPTPEMSESNNQLEGCRHSESEYLSDQLLNTMQISAVFFNREGMIFRTNMQCREDLCISEASLGQKITDVFSVICNNRDIFSELLAELDKSDVKSIRLPANAFIRINQGKKQFFVNGCISRPEPGYYLLSFQNIMEEITREQILGMVLARTKIFPWFYDTERNKMLIDAQWFAYLGIPPGDGTLSQEEFFERVHPDERTMLAEALEQQLSDHEIHDSFAYRLRRGDGTWEWFSEQSMYLSQTDNGSPYRVVGVCQSIQNHKVTEENLRAARDKAELADRLKTAFLANMSHEIRTPLNAIIGFSNLLVSGVVPVNSPEGEEFIEMIDRNSNHLLTLISDILDLSCIESGTMEYTYAELSLKQFLQNVYQAHLPHIPPQVSFNLLLAEKEMTLMTDPIRVRQIMNNLLTNAIKFTQNGRIDLGYRLVDGGTTVELFVEDTGCGIPENQCEKIFDRFHKVNTFVQGAGLGLSICKTIAKHLEGSISVFSRLGEGSRFTLRLPVKRKYPDSSCYRYENEK